MAKLSGFFMSTLLIILCLWINVCHYPDAARTAPPSDDASTSVDAVPQSVSPASEPVKDAPPQSPPQEAPSEQSSERQGGLLADVGAVPELLDVSATRPTATDDLDPATAPPVLPPASFPVDGAEIDDAPQSDASQTASPAVATPTQDVRRSATKPRGAKYVRVPDVEIDAFSGGVRTVRASNDELRVVGATRAGQTSPVVSSAP